MGCGLSNAISDGLPVRMDGNQNAGAVQGMFEVAHVRIFPAPPTPTETFCSGILAPASCEGMRASKRLLPLSDTSTEWRVIRRVGGMGQGCLEASCVCLAGGCLETESGVVGSRLTLDTCHLDTGNGLGKTWIYIYIFFSYTVLPSTFYVTHSLNSHRWWKPVCYYGFGPIPIPIPALCHPPSSRWIIRGI